MFSSTLDNAISKAKNGFNEYIGLPYFATVCIFYCVFSLSPYWFAPLVILKIGSRILWVKLKPAFIQYRLQKICDQYQLNPKTINKANLFAALEETRFDINSFFLFPTKKEAIFIFVKLQNHQLALKLIKGLQSITKKDQDQDQDLALLKQIQNLNSRKGQNKNLPKNAQLIEEKLEKFAIDFSHNKLQIDQEKSPKQVIAKKWIEELVDYAQTGKHTSSFASTVKRIHRIAYYNDRISNEQPVYSISQSSCKKFFNYFAKDIEVTENIRGLQNLGNTCYMNSALQCLHKTFELTEAIKEVRSNSHFVKAYLQLMQELSINTSSPFCPRQIKSMIGQYNPIFQDNAQHDAGELLSTVLNHLSDDLNTVSSARVYRIDGNVPRSDDELLQEYIRKDNLRCKSVIQDKFFGRFLTTYQCLKCRNKMKLFEKFNVLFLPVSSHGSTNMTVCMKEFMRPERLDGNNGWWCSKCQEDTDTDKTMSVYQSSPFLIVCFKRFTQANKINSFIDFDRKITLQHISTQPNTQKTTYELYGVINHAGSSLHYGHYYSFCLDGPTWRRYDDSRVREIREEDLVTEAAFVLLYRRKE